MHEGFVRKVSEVLLSVLAVYFLPLLRVFEPLFYAEDQPCVERPHKMQRLTARLLLLLALFGTVVPPVAAANAPPIHACCLRAAHHCHETSAASSGMAIRDASCCRGDCGRAGTISRCAYSRSSLVIFMDGTEGSVQSRPPFFHASQTSVFLSGRAPPFC